MSTAGDCPQAVLTRAPSQRAIGMTQLPAAVAWASSLRGGEAAMADPPPNATDSPLEPEVLHSTPPLCPVPTRPPRP